MATETQYEKLKLSTDESRAALYNAPIIQDVFAGIGGADSYVSFLSQAYHHVKHTVPLLMLMGAKLPARLSWLRKSVAQYIEEEIGHDEWILQDIAQCGTAAEMPDPPSPAVEIMVAYAYDLIQRVDPVGFLAMIFVLENTSVELALGAAEHIQKIIGLPDSAFTYLRTHGLIDQKHTGDLEAIINRLDPADFDEVLRHANIFYQLYLGVFHSIPRYAMATKRDH